MLKKNLSAVAPKVRCAGRFVLGLPPENPDFHPEAENWHRVDEPPVHVALWLVGFPVLALLGSLFYFVSASWLEFSFEQLFDELGFWWVFPVMFALVVARELCRALLHLDLGLSPLTIYGLDTRWYSGVYTLYDGPTTRARFMTIAIAPFIALSVVRLLIAALYPPCALVACLIAIVNAAFSAADVVNAIVMFRGIPADAIVRAKGSRTYWRLDATG